MAVLVCQTWRIIEDPGSLSARVLKARYFLDCHLIDASLGSSHSQAWHSLLKGRETLSLGLIKRIGSGTSTNIWTKNWLPRDYKLVPICSISNDQPQLVSELINPFTRSWDKQGLTEQLIAPDIEVILNIPLSSRVQEHIWPWHYEK